MLVHKGFFDERDRGALDDVVEVKKHRRRLLTFFLDRLLASFLGRLLAFFSRPLANVASLLTTVLRCCHRTGCLRWRNASTTVRWSWRGGSLCGAAAIGTTRRASPACHTPGW